MLQQLIQINFHADISKENLESAVAGISEKFNSVPGLQWKIWLINTETKEAGGIYLFESREAVDQFKNSELFKRTTSYPQFSVKQFDILEGASLVTHAPVGFNVARSFLSN